MSVGGTHLYDTAVARLSSVIDVSPSHVTLSVMDLVCVQFFPFVPHLRVFGRGISKFNSFTGLIFSHSDTD